VVLFSGVCRKTFVRDLWQNVFPLALGSVCKVSAQSHHLLSLRTYDVQLSRYKDSISDERSENRIPVGPSFSAPIQTGPVAHPASCTMGPGSFSGLKAAGTWPLPSTPCLYTEVKETVELHLYSPSVLSLHVRRWTELRWFLILRIAITYLGMISHITEMHTTLNAGNFYLFVFYVSIIVFSHPSTRSY
jgi:hypothetical protein